MQRGSISGNRFCAGTCGGLGHRRPSGCNGSRMSTSENGVMYRREWAMLSEFGDYGPQHTRLWRTPKCRCLQIKQWASIHWFGAAVWPWAAYFPPKARCPPSKARSLDEWLFRILPRPQRLFPEDSTQEGWPTNESNKVANVLGAQLRGDFHSWSSFRCRAWRLSNSIISFPGRDQSFRSHDFPSSFTLHRFLPHRTQLRESPDLNVGGCYLGVLFNIHIPGPVIFIESSGPGPGSRHA